MKFSIRHLIHLCKNQWLRYSLYLSLSAGLFFSGCHEENPCEGKKPFEADFLIQENVADSLVVTDTVCINSFATFTAKEDYDSYEWKIGEADSTWTTKQVGLLFYQDNVYPGTEIKVRLIARRKPNRECFPTDNGIDTVTKVFRLVSRQRAPIIGKYEGYFDSNPTQKEVVEIGWRRHYVNRIGLDSSLVVFNINRGCNLTLPPKEEGWPYPDPSLKIWAGDIDGWGAKAMYFNGRGHGGNNCNSPIAWLGLKDHNTLVVNFTYGRNQEFRGQFKGKRIR